MSLWPFFFGVQPPETRTIGAAVTPEVAGSSPVARAELPSALSLRAMPDRPCGGRVGPCPASCVFQSERSSSSPSASSRRSDRSVGRASGTKPGESGANRASPRCRGQEASPPKIRAAVDRQQLRRARPFATQPMPLRLPDQREPLTPSARLRLAWTPQTAATGPAQSARRSRARGCRAS
jgi:hypothetical protein